MEEHHYLIRGGIAGRERLRVLARDPSIMVSNPYICQAWGALAG